MNTDKNAQINAAIVKAMQSGLDVQQAIDAVLGAGMFMRIAETVYNEIRARQAK